MDKYFETLWFVFRMHYRKLEPQAVKERMYLALDRKHDVGDEADYIINIWKEGIDDENFNIRARRIFNNL